jgi:hypothetical protein
MRLDVEPLVAGKFVQLHEYAAFGSVGVKRLLV